MSLLGELALELKGEDLYAAASSKPGELPAPQAFDEQPMLDLQVQDLDTDLMLAGLGDYCRTLGERP